MFRFFLLLALFPYIASAQTFMPDEQPRTNNGLLVKPTASSVAISPSSAGILTLGGMINSTTNINAATTDNFDIGGVTREAITAGEFNFIPAATTTSTLHLTFAVPADTTMTTLQNVPVWNVNGVGVLRQHAAGTIPLQTDYIFGGATNTFVSASTLTEGATLNVQQPNCTTNCTETRAAAIYIGQATANSTNTSAGAVALASTVTTSTGLDVWAATGATNNYAALFETGNIGVGVTSPSQLMTLSSGGSYAWDSGSGTADTGISRGSAAVVDIGNGAPADASGTVNAAQYNVAGSQIACSNLSNGATGCSTATGTSGAKIPLLNGANTWSGAQTIDKSDLLLLGSSTGYTTLNSGLSSTSNNTLTLPITSSDTLAALGTAQTWTAAQTFTNSDILLLGSSTGYTTFTSANSSASDYTLTFPAATDTLADLAGTQTLTNKTIAYSSNTLTGVAPTASPTFSGTVTMPDSGTWGSGGINGSNIGATTRGSANITSLNANNGVVVTGGSAPSLSNGTAYMIGSTTNGNQIGGQGSTNDLTFENSGGTVVLSVPTSGSPKMPNLTNADGDDILCWQTGGQLTYDTAAGCVGLSDARVKTNIKPIDGLKAVMCMAKETGGVSFDWLDINKAAHEGRQIGLIAQAVEKCVPELVHEKQHPVTVTLKDGTKKTFAHLKTIDYEHLPAILVNAMAEQQKEIEAMQGKRLLVAGHKCFFNLLICAD